MALKTKVKVGNISNLSDARYYSGMGVDFLGFPFSEDHFDADVKNFQDISSWVAGPAFVLEWTGSYVSDNFFVLAQSGNALVIEISVSHLENFAGSANQLIIKLDATDWTASRASLLRHADRIKYILLTSAGETLPDVDLIRSMESDFSVLVGTGISEAALDALLAIPVSGIALLGSIEDMPGLKEYDLTAIFEKLELPE